MTRRYRVHSRNRPDDEKIVEVTDEDLVARYGTADETPSIMFVKDLSCRRGLFSWGEYDLLKVRRER